MTVSPRPRRSALYLPGSNARALEKARTLDADVIIIDLEDAVAPDVKDEARRLAVEAVRAGGFGRREVVIRINALDTPWGQADLAAVAQAGPDAILAPKLAGAADVRRYSEFLASAPPHTMLWGMIETTRALFSLAEIAATSATTRLGVWVIGTNDLAKEMRCRLTADRAPLWAPLSLAVAAARSGGLSILDGVYNDLDDDEGFLAACAQGVAFGFDGKTLIHPRQIDPCNAAFSPSESEIAEARDIIAAFDQPENRGLGVIRLYGKMVERLHLAAALSLVAQADALATAET